MKKSLQGLTPLALSFVLLGSLISCRPNSSHHRADIEKMSASELVEVIHYQGRFDGEKDWSYEDGRLAEERYTSMA